MCGFLSTKRYNKRITDYGLRKTHSYNQISPFSLYPCRSDGAGKGDHIAMDWYDPSLQSLLPNHYLLFTNNYSLFSMITINESFCCINCNRSVPKASATCRNHCPYCFISLHVDKDIPWDRKTSCHGIMIPIGYEMRHSEIKIVFECTQCGKTHQNKRAQDDEIISLDQLIKEHRDQNPLHRANKTI